MERMNSHVRVVRATTVEVHEAGRRLLRTQPEAAPKSSFVPGVPAEEEQ